MHLLNTPIMYDESSALKKAIRLSQTESSQFKERLACSAEPVMNVREKDTANYKLNYKQVAVNKEQEEITEIVKSIGHKMKWTDDVVITETQNDPQTNALRKSKEDNLQNVIFNIKEGKSTRIDNNAKKKTMKK